MLAFLIPVMIATPPPIQPLFSNYARWIWDGGPEKPVDAYRLFRKSFELKSGPKKAILRITADAEYRLFINSEYIARGPAPNPPSHTSVDELDIAGKLHGGRNVIAVIVHHLGVPSFPRMLGRAGLLAELTLPGQTIATDESWKWHDAWWNFTNERFSPFRGFTEELDANKMPADWSLAEFDDSKWKRASALGPIGTSPWLSLEIRDIPMPDTRKISAPTAGLVRTGVIRLDPPPKKEAAREITAAALVSAATPAGPDSSRDPGSLIIFDFGREVSGYPEFHPIAEEPGAVLDIGYGEGLDKDGRISVLRQGNPDCDRLILKEGIQHLTIFHHRAFRYMVIAVRSKRRVIVSRPTIAESGYPLQDHGKFHSSDPKLDKIWEVGRHTMRICMDQGFMDCPLRERGQYIGDGLAEGPVALHAFGDTKLMRRFLRQGMLCQPEDGLLEPAYPCDWTAFHTGRKDANRIPGYGLLWLVMLEDYYRNTGDKALVEELKPTATKLLAWFDKYRGADGLLRNVPEWNFIDWSPLKPESAAACLNLQYYMALRSAADLGVADAAMASAIQTSFERDHWDEARGLYRDANGLYTVHTNVLALLTVVKDANRAARIIEEIQKPNDLLKPESPYFDGYTLRAVCKWNRHDLAVKMIHDKWGPMIDQGATTFWEAWENKWSQCHAWSCTPTALLSSEILGISYDASRKLVTFAPHPAGLSTASGVAPMQCGNVSAKWKVMQGGLMEAAIETPRSVRIRVDVPASNMGALMIDGKVIKHSHYGGRLTVEIPGGKHDIKVG